MTGLHTGHTWVRGNVAGMSLRAEDRTVATMLKAAGYRTALVGKWGLGESESPGTARSPRASSTHSAICRRRTPTGSSPIISIATGSASRSARTSTRTICSRAKRFRSSRRKTTGRFSSTSITPCRTPSFACRTIQSRHSGAGFPKRLFVNAAADARLSGPDEPSLGYRSQPTPHAAFAAHDHTHGSGRRPDRRAAARPRPGSERTLIIFTSDNGPHQEGGADPDFFKSSGGLRGIKRDLYEGGIRVPMIASWAGNIAAGTTTMFAAAHWDWFPTFAELAGVKPPQGLDGTSRSCVLFGQASTRARVHVPGVSRTRFSASGADGQLEGGAACEGPGSRAVRSRDDPTEFTDVASKHPDVVAQIETYLKTARTDSPNWPVK